MKIVTESSLDRSESCGTIRTTLYALIEALNAEAEPGEEHLVVAAVVHLLNTGRIRFLKDLRVDKKSA